MTFIIKGCRWRFNLAIIKNVKLNLQKYYFYVKLKSINRII